MTKFIRRKYIVQETEQRQPTFFKRFAGQSMALSFLLFLVIVGAGFSYLFYINQTATGSFEIKGLESRVSELQETNKKLELKTAEMQSLSVIEEGIKDLQMVAVSRVEYLPAVGAAVAVR